MESTKLNLQDISVLIRTAVPEATHIKIMVEYELDTRTGSYHAFDDYELLDDNGTVLQTNDLNIHRDLSKLFTNDNYYDDVEWDEYREFGTLTFDLNWQLVS